MSELYFTCDWVIRPAVNYVRLEVIAHECGCELAIAQANIVTPERLVMMRFALCAPSEAALTHFLARVAPIMDRWHTSDSKTFAPALLIDLHTLQASF